MKAIISTIRAVAQNENWSAEDMTLKLCDYAEAAEARAEQFKSDAMRFETERDSAIDSAEYYKHTHLSMQTTIDELTAQLATAQAQLTRMTDWAQYWLLVDMKVTGANDLLVLRDDINTSRAMLAKDAKP